MATLTLSLPDTDDGYITEEQFEDSERKMREYAEASVPRYWIVERHPHDPADGIVQQFVNRGGAFAPEVETELSKLIAG